MTKTYAIYGFAHRASVLLAAVANSIVRGKMRFLLPIGRTVPHVLIGAFAAVVACGLLSPIALAQSTQPAASPPAPLSTPSSSPGATRLAPDELRAWRAALPKSPPKKGCYSAHYPSAKWQEVPCATPPDVPYGPGQGLAGATHDYLAATTTPIGTAIGSFNSVTGVINEADQGTANKYSLQLNTNQFSGPSACNGAENPNECQGWQQFVYSNAVGIFIQYWLVNYAKTCPKGWNTTTNGNCWKNAPTGAAYGPVPITDLDSLVLTGEASSNLDSIMIMGVDGNASASNTDSVLGLGAGFWNTAEFNVLGDGGGTSAHFNSGVEITVQTVVDSLTSALPSCIVGGNTAESNNLDLLSCVVEPSAIVFTESNPPGSIWQWLGLGCNGSSCTGWQEFDDNNESVRIAATDSKLFQLWNSGNVWQFTGTACGDGSCPGWEQIDSNPNTYEIVAGGNKLYQLENNGRVRYYTGGTNWQLLDNNAGIVTLAAAVGGLFELHSNGDIWKYTGTPCSSSASCPGWQQLDNNPAAVAIAAANDNFYEMHNDGTIWAYTGTPCNSSGCPGWQLLGYDPNTLVMAAGGNNLIELNSVGQIWQYVGPPCNSTSCPGWIMIDDNPAAFNIAADSNNLYELHNTGALWHYTGTACSGNSCPGWELIDNNPWTGRIAATAGNLYELHVEQTPPLRSLICYDCR